jgi:uracil-DNA glycosylase family 4
METLERLLERIKQCKICEPELPLGANPVLMASKKSKIMIIGQAPGIKVHLSGIPFHDKSGDQLRRWLDVTVDEFYNPDNFAIVPMGFCYPGKGKQGDLPPRKECAPTWHEQLLEHLTEIQLILLVGQYAQKYYLKKEARRTLTENVAHYQDFLPRYFPLPHPSPRNFMWKAKNQWFEEEIIPELKKRIRTILNKK